MKKQGLEKKVKGDQRAALAGWEDEGGAAPSARGGVVEHQRQEEVDRTGRRATVDATHDSSARGEHRYPDSHQTEAEQQTRRGRDELKRKLGGR